MSLNNRMYLYLGGLIFLLPFMKIQIFYDPFTMGRFVLWSILSLASLLLLYPKFKQIRIDRVDWIIGSFYLINLVSDYG